MKEATAALKLALEALEMHVPHVYKDRGYGPITAIKEALAPTSTQCEVQDELCSSQEPVFLIYDDAGGWIESNESEYSKTEEVKRWLLYTTPPKRPWAGLTDDEYDEIWRMDLNNKDIMDKTIAKLKEINT